jgi:hypothetical protein
MRLLLFMFSGITMNDDEDARAKCALKRGFFGGKIFSKKSKLGDFCARSNDFR